MSVHPNQDLSLAALAEPRVPARRGDFLALALWTLGGLAVFGLVLGEARASR